MEAFSIFGNFKLKRCKYVLRQGESFQRECSLTLIPFRLLFDPVAQACLTPHESLLRLASVDARRGRCCATL